MSTRGQNCSLAHACCMTLGKSCFLSLESQYHLPTQGSQEQSTGHRAPPETHKIGTKSLGSKASMCTAWAHPLHPISSLPEMSPITTFPLPLQPVMATPSPQEQAFPGYTPSSPCPGGLPGQLSPCPFCWPPQLTVSAAPLHVGTTAPLTHPSPLSLATTTLDLKPPPSSPSPWRPQCHQHSVPARLSAQQLSPRGHHQHSRSDGDGDGGDGNSESDSQGLSSPGQPPAPASREQHRGCLPACSSSARLLSLQFPKSMTQAPAPDQSRQHTPSPAVHPLHDDKTPIRVEA